MTSNNGTYIFDFDDNLMFLDTEILVKNKKGEIKKMTTSKYASFKNGNNGYFLFDWSFEHFCNDSYFPNDLEKAIKNKKFWPAIEDFKKCILNLDPFSIITARWNSRKTIMDWLEQIIENYLNKNELKQLQDNLQKKYRIKNFKRVLKYYLLWQFIYPVNSKEFRKDFSKEVEKVWKDNISWLKTIAFKDYIENIYVGWKITVWFSDDNEANINAIHQIIKENFYQKYKNKITFYLYHMNLENWKKEVRILN